MLQNIIFCFVLFPFENRQADISRMLARIQSSNVELLYIQTGTGGAFNSSNASCNPNLFFFTLVILQDFLRYFEVQYFHREKNVKTVIKMHQKAV